jgi:acyl-CoA thioester hydrolase
VREFRLRRRVQFYETDAAGLVHFTWFFRYMEEAEHALWREAGLSIHPRDTDIGWPRVSTAFEFHRPLRFEDEFEIVIRVTSISRRTISYECTVTKGDERVATGMLTISCVQKRSEGPLRSIDVPDEIRERLSQS